MEAQVAKSRDWQRRLPPFGRMVAYDSGLGDDAPIGYHENGDEEKFAYPRDYKIVGWPLRSKGRTLKGAKAFAKAKGWKYDDIFWSKSYYVFVKWVG